MSLNGIRTNATYHGYLTISFVLSSVPIILMLSSELHPYQGRIQEFLKEDHLRSTLGLITLQAKQTKGGGGGPGGGPT